MEKDNLCVNCMREIDLSIGGGEICPHCGFNNNTPGIKGSLEYKTLLQQRYVTGRVKSANSEGFTYICFDRVNNVPVDVREFYPTTLVYRDGTVMHPAEGNEAAVDSLFNEFTAMAGSLIRLKELASIVTVQDIFYENKTAYIVYEHFDSISLKSFVESKELDWNTVKKLFLPMLPSLSSMHAFGIKHLGISPETLRVCRDGKMRLSEFSAESVRRVGSPLECDLVTGCAAPEQYVKRLECDEITDVYGFTACMFFAITGQLPDDSRKRIKDQRLMISREKLKILPPNVVSAIANGLQVTQENRISSFERLRAELSAAPTVTNEIQESSAVKSLPKISQNIPQDRGFSPKFWLIGSFILTAVILTLVGYYIINYTDFSFKDISSAIDKVTETSAVEVVTVPNFVGGNYNDWLDKLKDTNVYKFSFKVDSREFSEDIPEGEIISQKPAAGDSVQKNGIVSIVVSRGSTERTLPVINGIKFTTALEELQKEGFEVVKEEVYDNKAAAGNVIWYQDYNSGDKLPYGTVVTVVVSLGPEPKS